MSRLPVRWKVLSLVFIAVAAAASASASACGLGQMNTGCAPVVTLTVGSQSYDVSANSYNFTDGHWVLSFSPQSYASFAFLGGKLTSDSDPYIAFSWGVSNPSASAQAFSFDVVAPFSGGPYQLAESFFTDALLTSQGTSTVGPNGDSFIMESYVNGSLISGFGMGTGCTATPSTPCNSSAPNVMEANYVSPASGTLELKFSFIVGPYSNYSFQGETDLLPTPEPGTMLMLGSGVVGLAGLLRRKL